MKKNFTALVLFFLYFPCSSQEERVTANQTDSAEIIQIFTTSGEDAEAQADNQDISSLLQASKDVFTQMAAFQFGGARYRLRGLQAENQQVLVNGITMSSPETGVATWSSWGGLNDVTRLVESRFGITAGRYSFSGAGGYTHIEAGASAFKKGTRVSWAGGNRFFRSRTMLTHATGQLPGGWAFSGSVSWRTGREVYVPGTYFEGASFYISAEKKKGKHLFGLTGFAAPTEQGRSNAAQQEAYELAANNYYNSAWGYQAGKVRNSAIARSNRPSMIARDIIELSPDERISAACYYTFGRSGMTGINRYDAPNPKPDYYRYLPSYFYLRHDTVQGDLLKEQWAHESTRQLDWDRMIRLNQNNLYSDPQSQVVNTSETRARYILENRVESVRQAGINVTYNRRSGRAFLSGGFHAYNYTGRKFKELEDLLGASFWLDVDQFAEDLGVEDHIRQNDIDQPNRKVRQGEKFGYDYAIRIQKAEAWAQVEHSYRNIEFYYGGSASACAIWREGYMANGKFPETSKGQSEKRKFANAAVKAGLVYKLSGRQFITANALALTRAPEAGNLFISPRVRNEMVSDLGAEQLASADISYQVRFPAFKMRATAYTGFVRNQVWLRTYWHDSYNTNVNLIMTEVNESQQGLELGAEKTLASVHVLQLAAAYGRCRYSGRPQLEAWQDNNSKALFSERTVYMDNYFSGGAPQSVAGIGYKYNGQKRRWFASINFNYAADIYLEPNPDRRTAEATEKYSEDEAALAEVVIAQERLPSYYFVNVFCGKTWRLLRKYNVNAYLSVNNILNSREAVSSGFEQLRWDPAEIRAFPPKYYYMHGTTYMLMLNLNF